MPLSPKDSITPTWKLFSHLPHLTHCMPLKHTHILVNERHHMGTGARVYCRGLFKDEWNAIVDLRPVRVQCFLMDMVERLWASLFKWSGHIV